MKKLASPLASPALPSCFSWNQIQKANLAGTAPLLSSVDGHHDWKRNRPINDLQYSCTYSLYMSVTISNMPIWCGAIYIPSSLWKSLVLVCCHHLLHSRLNCLIVKLLPILYNKQYICSYLERRTQAYLTIESELIYIWQQYLSMNYIHFSRYILS